MKVKLMVMNGASRQTKVGNMVTLILAEPPAMSRLNAEFDFNLSDKQAQEIRPEQVLGKVCEFDLLSMNIWNGRVSFRGEIVLPDKK